MITILGAEVAGLCCPNAVCPCRWWTAALRALADGLRRRRVGIRYVVTHLAPDQANIDCRGIAARDTLPDLRAVRGEMLLHCQVSP